MKPIKINTEHYKGKLFKTFTAMQKSATTLILISFATTKIETFECHINEVIRMLSYNRMSAMLKIEHILWI